MAPNVLKLHRFPRLFIVSSHNRVYLLLVAVSQDPVFLLWVEKEAEDIKSQAVLLVGRPLIKANEQAALHLRVRKKHNLEA